MTRRMPDGVVSGEMMAANVSADLKREKTGKRFGERRTGTSTMAVNLAGSRKASKEDRAFADLLVRVRSGKDAAAVKELEEKFHARIISGSGKRGT